MKAATHNGPFHADDVLATAILFRRFANPSVTRTRNPDELAAADLRFDVGLKYDPATRDFDHHQGAGARPNGIPYAAAGLLWKEYGAEICGDHQDVADEVDKTLIQPVDAHDNGYQLAEFLHETKPLTISGIIGLLNPSWDEQQDFDNRFWQAVRIAGDILNRAISMAEGRVNAQQIVETALQERQDPRLVILPQFVPWQEVLCADPDALYVVYPGMNNQWNVQCVPVAAGVQQVRKPPPAWPQSPAEIAAATDVHDAVFCHKGRFLAAATSQAGALALAHLAVSAEDTK